MSEHRPWSFANLIRRASKYLKLSQLRQSIRDKAMKSQISDIQQLIEQMERLYHIDYHNHEHRSWKLRAEAKLKKFFGEESNLYKEFSALAWMVVGRIVVNPRLFPIGTRPQSMQDEAHQEAYVKDLDRARGILEESKQALFESEQDSGSDHIADGDYISPTLRAQIMRIWEKAVGPFKPMDDYTISNTIWYAIYKTVVYERGYEYIGDRGLYPEAACKLFLERANTQGALTIVEVSFKYIQQAAQKFDSSDRRRSGITLEPEDAIDEINDRLQRNGVKYHVSNGKLIKHSSLFLHKEVVEPALRLLHDEEFDGASEEFERAHRHFRNGDIRDAISSAANAFESTMKTICERRGWEYDADRATAKVLVDIVIQNGLVPPYMNNELTGLRTILESAVPTVRNRQGGHGQGATVAQTPERLASFVLHVTAANIVFLVESYKSLP